MLIFLILFLGVAALLLVGTRLPSRRLEPFLALPEHRYAPLFFGVVAGAAIWYIWGGLNAPTPVHDEASYLLQAQTFASFHWAMPSPPLPQFFEQYHVLVTPTFASKYPPGHGLVLVPGVWLSLPGLIPVLLSAIAGGLLFALVRRVSNGWVATLTFLLWLPSKANLRFRGSYMSETTTSVLWLLGWWALLEWRRTRSTRWLMLVAGCVAWMGITRPFTAIAFTIPIAVVVLTDIARRRDWRQLVRPALVGVAILAILPIWDSRTLGDWRTAPYKIYSQIYFPYDDIGFGVKETPPQRELPVDMQDFASYFKAVHAEHTSDKVLSIFGERWIAIASETLHGWRLSLAVFTAVGLIVLGAEGWFAVASALLLVIVYLAFAHPVTWTIYYLEIFPIAPFITALGVGAVATALTNPKAPLNRQLARQWGLRQSLALALVVLVFLWPATRDTQYGRRYQIATQRYHLQFRELLARIPDQRAIVFVRYSPSHISNSSLIANDADLARAKLWIVYDRGPENEKLLARAPDRKGYLYDERSHSLSRLLVASR